MRAVSAMLHPMQAPSHDRACPRARLACRTPPLPARYPQVTLVAGPGGFSADGQPNDAFHGSLEACRSATCREMLGLVRNPLARMDLSKLPMKGDGMQDYELTQMQIVQAHLVAQDSMTKPLLDWSWRSRQLVTVNEQAAWLAEDSGMSFEDALQQINGHERPSLPWLTKKVKDH